jgi:iron complex outermembrane receptor protein
MLTRMKIVAPLGICVAALTAATAASAQTSAAQPNTTNGLEEVLVTAQRRSENLQDVPISVTSFSASDLATLQMDSTLDLGRIVPNFFSSNNVGQGSANVYYIRGLGQTQSFPTFEPEVGTYVDDIYIARVNANNFALFGVEQVQVLNGPQGTLFGRNSAGGAILVTLAKPGHEFGGDAQVGFGSFNGFNGRFSVSVPISEQFLTRTSVYGITNDGYVDDLTTHENLNHTRNWGVREAATILPGASSNFEWNLSADYEHNDAANLLNQPSDTGGVNGSDRISYSGFSQHGGALLPYLSGPKAGYGQGALVVTYGVASNVKLSFDAGTLNFITGYRGLRQDLAADFAIAGFLGEPLAVADAVPTGEIALAQRLRSNEYTQEVKWTAKVSDSVNYTAGVYYLYETNGNNFGQVLGLGPAFALTLNDQYTDNTTSSTAGYAQGDFRIAPKLTLTVGGRFTHEVKDVEATPNAAGRGFTTAQIQAAGNLTHLTANEFTPRVALQYQVDPQLMVFASATRGFQGGGWNGLTGANPVDYNNFAPETIWSYETGFRYETQDRRLRLNVTAFYEDVTAYQLLSDNPHDPTPTFDTSNAANMTGYGLEASVAWQPIQPLTLSGNISSMRAYYYDASALIRSQQALCRAGVAGTCDAGIVRTDGSLATPVYTPPLAVSGTASYIFGFGGYTLTPTVSVQYVASEWFDTANSNGYAASNPAPAGGETKPRTLLDAGVTWAPRNMRLTVTAECKNCTKVNYGTANLLGLDYFNYPGTWGVAVSYKF